MIFVSYELSEWLEKHPHLEVLKLACNHCGNDMVSNLPFIEKGYVGLTSAPCKCGKSNHICESKITTSRDTYNLWMSLTKNYL